ncbi:MAG: zinc ribbon domain-containing protein [Candidatus Stahlbacteria bacterium]|nr:zinc ribbon domain-containing protein [Candidatus Stahlbacteria bacterium]
MPIYEYKCESCGKEIEFFSKRARDSGMSSL